MKNEWEGATEYMNEMMKWGKWGNQRKLGKLNAWYEESRWSKWWNDRIKEMKQN